MKKVISSLCMLLALSACKDQKKAQTNEKPVVKIGAELPLSGEYARIGEANRQAILMALEKWQNKNTKYKYEVIFEDDQMVTSRAAMVANKFINVDKVKGIISTWGIVGPVVADVANKNQVISMACAGMKEIVEPYYSFNHFTQDDKLAEKLVPLLKKKDIHNVVFAYTAAAAYDEKAKTMEQKLTENGINVLAVERYNISETDFRVSIRKLEQLNPEAYIDFVMMPGTVNFIKQFDEITQGKRLLIGLHVFNEMPAKYWPMVEGLYSVRDTNGTQEFSRAFEEKTGLENQPCNGNHFDNLDLLIWAFENTPVKEGKTIPDTKDVVETLHSVKNWKGAVGKISVEDSGLINSEALLEIYQDGKPVPLGD